VAHGKIEVNLLGFVVVGVEDIELTGLWRWFKRNKSKGPYLITSRAAGLALDATEQYNQGHRVATALPHELPRQL
jgi:hypothetical protein